VYDWSASSTRLTSQQAAEDSRLKAALQAHTARYALVCAYITDAYSDVCTMRARRAWMLNKRRPPSWLSSVEQMLCKQARQLLIRYEHVPSSTCWCLQGGVTPRTAGLGQGRHEECVSAAACSSCLPRSMPADIPNGNGAAAEVFESGDAPAAEGNPARGSLHNRTPSFLDMAR
jgi:hypothetical protein